jgi:hypothetical protein
MITVNQKSFILDMLCNWVCCHRLVSAQLDVDAYLVKLMPKEDSMSKEAFLRECWEQRQLVVEKYGCEKVSAILNRKVNRLDDLTFSDAKKVISTLKNENLSGLDWFRRYSGFVRGVTGDLNSSKFHFKGKIKSN